MWRAWGTSLVHREKALGARPSACYAPTMNTATENTSITAPSIDFLAEYDKATALAEATPCAVNGCQGEGHEANAPATEWMHCLPDQRFDGNSVRVGMWTSDNGLSWSSDVSLEGSGQMTSAELRAEALLYESYPAFLRAAADKLDSLNNN